MRLLDAPEAIWIGRVWRPDVQGPAVVTMRDEIVIDITTASAPTVSHLLELPDAAAYVRSTQGAALGKLDAISATSISRDSLHLLSPCDLQTVKACGVTFAHSMIERVIEEMVSGDPARAESIRDRIGEAMGDSLGMLRAGSPEAAKIKRAMQEAGLWSQYLEVGIGPDAEVFTKCPPMASVGPGAQVGLHPDSRWNNPEPEVVLAVSSAGRILGATLGNDVNLRDIEGRSALLLGKAKDNNASCAIGPMIRLFDESFSLDDVRRAELTLMVRGLDGYRLEGQSSMSKISRDPEDLVAQTMGRHHQYPDGLVLFLGTLFTPTQDRDVLGEGFTHKSGDVVTISAVGLGNLTNTVGLSTEAPKWTFGTRALMENLAARGLLGRKNSNEVK